MKNRKICIKTTLLITLFFVSAIFSFGLVNQNEESNITIEQNPSSAATIELGINQWDELIYRRMEYNTSDDLKKEEYNRNTISSISDTTNQISIDVTTHYASSENNFDWELTGNQEEKDHIFENATKSTWVGNGIFVKNLDLSDNEIQTTIINIFVNNEGAVVQNSEFGTDYFILNNTDSGQGFDWEFKAVLDLNKGIVLWSESYNSSKGRYVEYLVSAPGVLTPQSSSVSPGDTLDYLITAPDVEDKTYDIDYVYKEYMEIDELVGHLYEVVIISNFTEISRFAPQPESLIREDQDGPAYVISNNIVNFADYEINIEDFFNSMPGVINTILNTDGLYFKIELEYDTGENSVMEMRYNDARVLDFYREKNNKTGSMKLNDALFLKSGPGVLDSSSDFAWLTVDVGDTWEYINMHEGEDYGYVNFRKYEVTHILTINGSGAVFGNIYEGWDQSNYEMKVEGGIFILSDGNANSLDFMQSKQLFEELLFLEKDWREYEMPPGLFPIGLNLGNLLDALETMVTMEWGITPNFVNHGVDYVLISDSNSESYFYSKISNYGMFKTYETRSLDVESKKSHEKSILLSISSEQSSSETAIFNVPTTIQYEQSSSDENWSGEKYKSIIEDIVITFDGHQILLGEVSYYKENENNWFEKTWNKEGVDTNYWIINSLDPSDPFTWAGQLMPKHVVESGFENYIDEIIWLFSSLMGEVTLDQITIMNQTSIIVDIENGDTTYSYRIRYNSEGLMQHMLFLTINNGEITNWQSEVLTIGPGDTGEYFTTTVEVGSISDTDDGGDGDDDDASTPGINGFPMIFSLMFSIIGILVIVKKKQH